MPVTSDEESLGEPPETATTADADVIAAGHGDGVPMASAHAGAESATASGGDESHREESHEEA